MSSNRQLLIRTLIVNKHDAAADFRRCCTAACIRRVGFQLSESWLAIAGTDSLFGGQWENSALGHPSEWVAEYGQERLRGTSFAAAYVTGVLARLISAGMTHAGALKELKKHCDPVRMKNYDAAYHGMGAFQF